MSIQIKVPIRDLEKEDVFSKVEKRLQSDPDNAYTVQGLMLELFNVKRSQIENKPFKDWDPGLPALYARIRSALDRMKKHGLVNSAKHSRAWVYWWSRK